MNFTVDQLSAVLFIDIETVPCASSFSQISPGLQEHWLHKARYIKNANAESVTDEELFSERAGIYSEFAKIVCIGIGCLVKKEKEWNLLLKSIHGDDEFALLHSFTDAVKKFAEHHPSFRFCGHNIKEFDMPFICRRMVINGVPLPSFLDLGGKRPWEVPHIDTLEQWRFGDHKHYTSLGLLAEIFGIPSPKDDIDGSMVAQVYWQERNLERIAKYCLQDVATSAKVLLSMSNHRSLIPDLAIINVAE